MKAEIKPDTHAKLKQISRKRFNEGRSDWSSAHILESIINKLHKKEIK